MKFNKFISIFLLGFSIILLSSYSRLTAQDNPATVSNAPASETIPETTPPVETAKAPEASSQQDVINAKIKQKIEEAKDYLNKANEAQKIGDYDKAYENAEKAKAVSLEANNLRTELATIAAKEKEMASKKIEAENKIKEAKDLIAKAEEKEGDKWAAEELASAKSSLLSAGNALEQKNYDESIKLASDSINYANNCLNKIEETKKKQEEDALKLKELPQQKLISKGNYMIKTNYVVRLIPERRDCLWRIAEYKYIYGNPWKWPVIYKANQDQIKNPDLIYPGQKFDIPAMDEQGNPLMTLEQGIKKESPKKEAIKKTSGETQTVPVNEAQEKAK